MTPGLLLPCNLTQSWTVGLPRRFLLGGAVCLSLPPTFTTNRFGLPSEHRSWKDGASNAEPGVRRAGP